MESKKMLRWGSLSHLQRTKEVSDMLRIAGIDPCAAIRAVAVDL